jgi:SAM-dependent methyltransferase
MKKYFTKSDKCRLCKSYSVQRILKLPSCPPGEQLRVSSNQKVINVPIDLFQCQDCFHVQILHVPLKTIMWNKDYTFMPSYNLEIVKHSKNTIRYFCEKFKPKIKKAFEIGSNDGLFLSLLKKKLRCEVLGIDPSAIPRKFAIKQSIPTINGFFNENYSKKIIKKHGKFDLVIANNVFAHVDNLDEMVNGICNLLEEDGYFIFEISYLVDVLQKKLLGTIIHEHLSIHSLTSLKIFFSKFNLEIIDIIHSSKIQGGALIGFVRKKNINKISKKVNLYLKKEKKIGLNRKGGLIKYENKFNKEINEFISKIKKLCLNKKIICYGASRSLPAIVKILKLENKIRYILDDNKFKFNKYAPLKSIKILDSKKYYYDPNDFYLITGWVHTKKILKKLRRKIVGSKNFITIYPKFDIFFK